MGNARAEKPGRLAVEAVTMGNVVGIEPAPVPGQRLRMGRRSTGAGRSDVMSPGCQLDGHASISSLDEPVHANHGEEDFTLGDPAQAAVRNSDWGEFMSMLDGRQQYIVRATAGGERLTDQATQLKVTPSAVCQRRDTIAKRARAFWGESVLQDAERMPLWRRQEQRG